MLSIIVCSIHPDRLSKLRENIAATIGHGVEFEIIAIDNRISPRSIAAVYNHGASRAKFPYLLFIHEDAGFVTQDWWSRILPILSLPRCGVVGFAGSKAMPNAPTGWSSRPEWNVLNLRENDHLLSINADPNLNPIEVVALDGFALFVSQANWARAPFDEDAITGFHCYDIDFCLGMLPESRNFVCTNVIPYHNSKGNFDISWLRATYQLYYKKWHNILPLKAEDFPLSDRALHREAEQAHFRFLKAARTMGLHCEMAEKAFSKFPLSPRHFEHIIKLALRKPRET